MKHDGEQIRLRLREVLADDAEALLDFQLMLLDDAIAAGHRFFHAREVWCKENLPAPHINALGRRYACAQIRDALYVRPGGYLCERQDDFLSDFYTNPESREGYRNLLAVGELAVEHRDDACKAYDMVADEVATRLLNDEHRHARHEIDAHRARWELEGLYAGSLTPPAMCYAMEKKTPVRTEGTALKDDHLYWRAHYHVPYVIPYDPALLYVQSKPECTLELMAQLAPDFPYDPKLSTAKRLLFAAPAQQGLAWGLMVDKEDGAREYRFPPYLVLFDASVGKKLKNELILFRHANLTHWYASPISPRAMEMQLRFHLPRLRRLLQFYQPYLERVLAELAETTASANGSVAARP